MSGRPLHASIVARHGPDGWRGVLIRGASGAGKSDLALRLAARPGWRLTADDYAHVWASGGALYAAPPATLAGWIEVRGVGLTPAPFRALCRLALAVDCVAGPVERLPEPERLALDGLDLPLIRLDPRPASAPQAAAAALDRACRRPNAGPGPAEGWRG